VAPLYRSRSQTLRVREEVAAARGNDLSLLRGAPARRDSSDTLSSPSETDRELAMRRIHSDTSDESCKSEFFMCKSKSERPRARGKSTSKAPKTKPQGASAPRQRDSLVFGPTRTADSLDAWRDCKLVGQTKSDRKAETGRRARTAARLLNEFGIELLVTPALPTPKGRLPQTLDDLDGGGADSMAVRTTKSERATSGTRSRRQAKSPLTDIDDSEVAVCRSKSDFVQKSSKELRKELSFSASCLSPMPDDMRRPTLLGSRCGRAGEAPRHRQAEKCDNTTEFVGIAGSPPSRPASLPVVTRHRQSSRPCGAGIGATDGGAVRDTTIGAKRGWFDLPPAAAPAHIDARVGVHWSQDLVETSPLPLDDTSSDSETSPGTTPEGADCTMFVAETCSTAATTSPAESESTFGGTRKNEAFSRTPPRLGSDGGLAAEADICRKTGGLGVTWAKGKRISSGSFGAVYMAMMRETGDIFAVKELGVGDSDDPEYRKTIEKELTICSSLSHPNIVPHWGHDWVGSTLFLFMEYMPGGSMASMLSQFGALSEDQLLRATRDLMRGLNYLHTRDPPVVHRDVKGGNLLVNLNFEVKLTDFGVSRQNHSSKSMSIIGSVPWMAPEVIRQQTGHGRKADIWSAGCTAIEMATAEKPWGNKRFDNLMSALCYISSTEESPPIPEGVELSPDLRRFIGWCTCCSAEERPTAAEALKDPVFERLTADSTKCS